MPEGRDPEPPGQHRPRPRARLDDGGELAAACNEQARDVLGLRDVAASDQRRRAPRAPEPAGRVRLRPARFTAAAGPGLAPAAASSITLKQCRWGIAVSVRSRTSRNRASVVGQRRVAAVDPPGAGLVRQEQVVGAGHARDVDVLANLEESLGPEHGKAPVTPRRKAVGGVPVDPEEAGRPLGLQEHLAVVVEVRVGPIGDRARDQLRVRRAREVQELVDLVRGEVAEDAAGAGGLEEPGRARGPVEAVRAKAGQVHDVADRTRLDQLGGTGHRPDFETLREVDGPDPSGLRLDPFHLPELLRRGDPGLVHHHVLPPAHGPGGDAGPLVGYRRRDDEVDAGVVEQAAGVLEPGQVGETLEEAAQWRRLTVGPEARALAAEREEAADLMVDVAMIEPNRRESKRGFVHDGTCGGFPRSLQPSFPMS